MFVIFLPIVIYCIVFFAVVIEESVASFAEVIPNFIGHASWNVADLFPVFLEFFEKRNYGFPIFGKHIVFRGLDELQFFIQIGLLGIFQPFVKLIFRGIEIS
ncbi:hypothetical protein SDC9_154598 [bioreactor metagenome]|uniref:Uncharacterized protein n=1 Tax=bioreactor metagenome TaxID=1076179 RepID=A0A645F1E5_9ZZZZ